MLGILRVQDVCLATDGVGEFCQSRSTYKVIRRRGLLGARIFLVIYLIFQGAGLASYGVEGFCQRCRLKYGDRKRRRSWRYAEQVWAVCVGNLTWGSASLPSCGVYFNFQ